MFISHYLQKNQIYICVISTDTCTQKCVFGRRDKLLGARHVNNDAICFCQVPNIDNLGVCGRNAANGFFQGVPRQKKRRLVDDFVCDSCVTS